MIETINTLNEEESIRYAEPNMVIRTTQTHPNDPYYNPKQWALYNYEQNPPGGNLDADIDAPEGWDYETGSSDILIVVMDSGIPLINGQLSHPDLNNSNGFILGPDYIDDPPNGVKDEFGHGTHVTGIISAETNNNEGIAGVNWNCQILTIQVFNSGGSGTWTAFKNGVYYAVDNYADIINFSGGGPYSATADTVVKYAHEHDVFQSYSAGNSGSAGVLYPARFAFESNISGYENGYSSVVSVAATQYDDERAWYSSYDPHNIFVSIAAPGGAHDNGYPFDPGDIFSTMPNYHVTLNDPPYNVSQDYGYLAGTSMAAPHVSGLAGLILTRFPNYTASEIRILLEESAEDVNGTTHPGEDKYLGHGRINAFYAIAPPAAPANLAVIDTVNQHPKLGWDKNDEPDIQYYQVWRWSGATPPPVYAEYSLLATTTDTFYIDEEVTLNQGGQAPVYSGYKVKAVDYSDQASDFSNNVTVQYSTPYSPKDQHRLTVANELVPSTVSLYHNYPNPFNPTTSISFGLPVASKVTLTIYSVTGEKVVTLTEGVMEKGYHSVKWNGRNQRGDMVASGIYIYELRAGDKRLVRKMLLAK